MEIKMLLWIDTIICQSTEALYTHSIGGQCIFLSIVELAACVMSCVEWSCCVRSTMHSLPFLLQICSINLFQSGLWYRLLSNSNHSIQIIDQINLINLRVKNLIRAVWKLNHLHKIGFDVIWKVGLGWLICWNNLEGKTAFTCAQNHFKLLIQQWDWTIRFERFYQILF